MGWFGQEDYFSFLKCKPWNLIIAPPAWQTQQDLEPYIGSSGRVSEVLNHKRRLSLQMVKRLHDGLNIPYESLLSAA